MKTKILILFTLIFSQIVLAQKENVKSDVSTKELNTIVDSTKTKKNKYFTVDILGSAIIKDDTKEGSKMQIKYPPNFIARQIRIMKSSGRFKYGLDFYLEKEYNDTYYTEFVNHEKLTFKNTNTNYYINPVFAFYPIQRKKYALGIHLETLIHLNSMYYNFNKNISLDNEYYIFYEIPSYIIYAVLPSEIEAVNEIKLTQNISLLNSVGFKRVSSHYFESWLGSNDYFEASMENSLFLNIGLRLNTQFFNQNKLIDNHYQNHGIIVNTGVSYGGVLLSRHFKDPEIVQSNIQYMISRLGLQSSFPLIEISLLSKNLINHTLGYNYSALSVSTVGNEFMWSDAEYRYKTNNVYYQFDKGLFKKKFNDKFFYPYIGCKIGLAYETFNSIYYLHCADMWYIFNYSLYSKQAYILTGQSVAGVRTNFNRVNIDMGIGYTLYSKLWGKYNFLYGKWEYPTVIETSYTGNLNTPAKFYFNDFYVKIGYKF